MIFCWRVLFIDLNFGVNFSVLKITALEREVNKTGFLDELDFTQKCLFLEMLIMQYNLVIASFL